MGSQGSRDASINSPERQPPNPQNSRNLRKNESGQNSLSPNCVTPMGSLGMRFNLKCQLEIKPPKKLNGTIERDRNEDSRDQSPLNVRSIVANQQ